MLSSDLTAGSFVFVVDSALCVHIAPDGPHHHPLVLGGAKKACYAGTLTIDGNGTVVELTNLSGTFKFESKEGLREVAKLIEAQGVRVAEDALFWFDPEGGSPPKRIRR